MLKIIFILTFLMVLFLVLTIYQKRNHSKITSKSTSAFKPDITPSPMMSGIEYRLFQSLVNALPECFICPQVSLYQILKVSGNSKEDFAYRNKLISKSLDFVVADRNGTVVAVIELDDKTHLSADRKLSDSDKDEALRAAGYKLFRWKTHKEPTPEQIRVLFTQDRSPLNDNVFQSFGPQW